MTLLPVPPARRLVARGRITGTAPCPNHGLTLVVLIDGACILCGAES